MDTQTYVLVPAELFNKIQEELEHAQMCDHPGIERLVRELEQSPLEQVELTDQTVAVLTGHPTKRPGPSY